MESGRAEGRRRRSAPALPYGFVPRPRILRLIDDAVAGSLVLIDAPPRRGKSTALLHWLESQRNAGACVYASLTGEPGEQECLGRELRSLVDGRVPGQIAVAIDHADRACTELVEVLAELAQSATSVRVVLAGADPSGRLASLASLRGPITRIGLEDLAFTPEEIGLLVESRPSGRPDEAESLRMWDMTHGHPFLLRLLLAGPSSFPGQPGGREGGGDTAQEWWAGLLLEQLPLEARETLLKASLLDSIGPSLLSRLFPGKAGAALRGVIADGWGTEDAEGRLALLPLLREPLRLAANRLLTPETMRGFATEAAAELVRIGDASLASFEFMLEAGHFEGLWRHYLAIEGTVLAEDIEAALARFPVDELCSSLSSTIVYVVVRSHREATPSRGLLTVIDGALDALSASPRRRASSAAAPGTERSLLPDVDSIYREAAVVALLRAGQRWTDAAEHVESLSLLVDALPLGPSPARDAGVGAMLSLAVLLVASGDLTRAMEIARRMRADAVGRWAPGWSSLRAFIHANRGEVDMAKNELGSVDASEAAMPGAGGATARVQRTIARAAVLLEGKEPAAAQQVLSGVEAELHGVMDWPYALVVTSRAWITVDPVAGLEAIDRLLELHGSRPMARAVEDLLRSALADLSMAAGELQRARRLLSDTGAKDYAMRLSSARLALHFPTPDVINDLRGLANDKTVWPRLRAQAHFLLSLHYRRSGEPTLAQAELKRAIGITELNKISLIKSLLPVAELTETAEMAGRTLGSLVNDSDPFGEVFVAVGLSQRESWLLQRLATGQRLQEIADAEFVSRNTLKSQSTSLYRKLGVKSRGEAVAFALEHGIVVPGPNSSPQR